MVSTILASMAIIQGGSGDAKSAYAFIKQLEGEWQGKSADGRKVRQVIDVIAGGSVVMERSWFDAHPGELMVTMYHLDRDKLILTHYCVARNQPTLEATAFSNGGRKMTFKFRSGTNMASRDTGHMDEVIFEMPDKDHMASRWTWYQNGKQTWMEKFGLTRVKSLRHSARVTPSARSATGCCLAGKE